MRVVRFALSIKKSRIRSSIGVRETPDSGDMGNHHLFLQEAIAVFARDRALLPTDSLSVSGGAVAEWSYPAECQAGHELGQGKVVVGRHPRDCPGATTHPGRGHLVVRCGTPGCASAWFRPKHGPDGPMG